MKDRQPRQSEAEARLSSGSAIAARDHHISWEEATGHSFQIRPAIYGVAAAVQSERLNATISLHDGFGARQATRLYS